MNSHEITILISLFSLGFFGSFSHCVGMCGPLVIAQANQRLETIKIADLTWLKRLSGTALIPYHMGRITTYAIIGSCFSWLSYNLKEIFGFRLLSAILLTIAGMSFILNLNTKIKLPFKINFITNQPLFLLKKMGNFFWVKPYGFRGYILGLILGFLPCGFLYGAFFLAAALGNFLLAGFGMLIFGIATIPSLFLTAYGGSLVFSKSSFNLLTKIILLINGLTLIMMAFGLILNRV